MQLPQNVQLTTLTPAVAGLDTASTGVMLPALSATQRWRVWALGACPFDTAIAWSDWRVHWSWPGGAALAAISRTGFGSDFVYMPGGFPLPANTRLDWNMQSSTAAGAFMIITAYATVEAV